MLDSYAAWKQICFDISSLIKRNKLSLWRFIRRTILSSWLSSNKKTPLTKYFDLDAALRTNGGRERSTLSFSYSQVGDMCTRRCHSHQKWLKILVMKWESKCMSVFSLLYFSTETRWPTSWWCSSVTTCRQAETSATTWLVYSADLVRPLLLPATWLPSKCCLWKR